ncbi:MAG: OmpA family protein [Rhizobiales bacterium]|nr:OmpA family protein [Hyphomicrobiales bacterium]
MIRSILAIAAAGLLLAACTTDPYTGEQKASNTAIGAGTGALLGTAAGALIGTTTKAKTGTSMLVGAGLGALAGGGVGLYMDNQEAKLRQRLEGTGVSVTRVGDNIVLNMPSNITFATDRAEVNPGFHDTLDSVAIVLQEFDKTRVEVDGHTDSDGSNEYNDDLSQRRASSVANYLTDQRLNARRFSVEGLGESQPIASNGSASGKAQNRRVEIQIVPLTEES